jgi:hypothetical protein
MLLCRLQQPVMAYSLCRGVLFYEELHLLRRVVHHLNVHVRRVMLL